MEEKKKKIEMFIKSNEKILQRLESNLTNNNIETCALRGENNKTALTAKISELKNTIDNEKNKLNDFETKDEITETKFALLGEIKKGGRVSGDIKKETTALGGGDKKKRNRNFKQKSFKAIEKKNLEKKMIGGGVVEAVEVVDTNYINYLKIEETIPEYMSKILLKMPNNKGFIWRGIRLYGKLPRTQQNVVFLDERKAGEMFIHEITPTHAKLYRKNRNGTLGSMVSSNIRKIKK